MYILNAGSAPIAPGGNQENFSLTIRNNSSCGAGVYRFAMQWNTSSVGTQVLACFPDIVILNQWYHVADRKSVV